MKNRKGRNNSKRPSPIVGLGVAAALAVLAVSLGAYAAFTDTESVDRAVDAGELDFELSPDLFSVTEMAPGDVFSRGMVIEIPEDPNDESLISGLRFDIEDSIANNACGGANPTCQNALANLLDSHALTGAVLACPSGGEVEDAAPTVDDDGNASTNARYDGPGPYTCSTGDFAIVGGPGAIRKAGTMAPTDPGFGPIFDSNGVETDFTPSDFGQDFYELDYSVSRTQTVCHAGPLGAPPSCGLEQINRPAGTFVDGSTIEMVTCISMPSDIGGAAIEDNDYENLSANIDFSWSATQRPGQVLDRELIYNGAPPSFLLAESCETALDMPPYTPVVGDPTPWDGDNQIDVEFWVDDQDGVFEPGGDDVPFEVDWLTISGPNMAAYVPTPTVDSNGQFSFVGVPDGTYTITAWVGGYFMWANPNPPGTDFVPISSNWGEDIATVTVTVAGGQTVGRTGFILPMGG